MVSMAELVTDVADIMNREHKTVNAYARAMIDAGELPKSSGRSVAHVEPKHIFRLFLAVALSPKIKDAPKVVKDYRKMPRGGINGIILAKGLGKKISDVATPETLFCIIWDLVQTETDRDVRDSLRDGEFEFVKSWPQITFTSDRYAAREDDPDSDVVRHSFSPANGKIEPDRFYKTSTIVSVGALIWLGFGQSGGTEKYWLGEKSK